MARISLSLLILLARSSLLDAISLSNFNPKSSNLPADCNAAYTQQIASCTDQDFKRGNQCSQACLDGLVVINSVVTSSCQALAPTADDKTIIGLMLQGKGIQALCNVAVVTRTTGGPQPTPAPGTTIQVSIGQSTMILSSTGVPSGGLLTDSATPGPTSAPPSMPPPGTTLSTSSLSTSSSSTSSTAANSQCTPNFQQGGTLFDATGKACPGAANSSVASLLSTSAFFQIFIALLASWLFR